MRTFLKSSIAGALALGMIALGTPNAHAGGWPIAAGVVGGLAVGTAIGATVAAANAAPVYAYPYPAYPTYPAYPAYSYATVPAPAYNYATPAVQSVQPVQQMVAPPTMYVQTPPPAPAYYGPAVYAAPYPLVYPYGRFGWGWGWGWRGGWGPGRYFYRR